MTKQAAVRPVCSTVEPLPLSDRIYVFSQQLLNFFGHVAQLPFFLHKMLCTSYLYFLFIKYSHFT